MGDMGDYYNAKRESRRADRAANGIDCPRCIELHPKRRPSILLPGQRCRVDGYVRPGERLSDTSGERGKA